MIAVDTNILVRILIDDKGQRSQTNMARALACKHKQLFISQIVQVELMWMLQSAYRCNKVQILQILTHLCENAAYVLQSEDQFVLALEKLRTANVEFSDLLILAESLSRKLKVYSFDKKFTKLKGVELPNG